MIQPPRIETIQKPTGCWITAIILIALFIVAVVVFEVSTDQPEYVPKWR